MRARIPAPALLATALACASAAWGAQSSPPAGALAAAGSVIEMQFIRARNPQELKAHCASASDPQARACSFARHDGNVMTCVIVALEPESFNDTARLTTFGREILNCLDPRSRSAAAAKR